MKVGNTVRNNMAIGSILKKLGETSMT